MVVIPSFKKTFSCSHHICFILIFFKKRIHQCKGIRRPFIIGIQEVHVFSLNIGKCFVSGGTDAAVFFFQINNIIRIFFLIFQTDFLTVIGASVIDQYHLYIFFKSNSLAKNRFQGLLQIFFHIIDRCYHGKLKLICFLFLHCKNSFLSMYMTVIFRSEMKYLQVIQQGIPSFRQNGKAILPERPKIPSRSRFLSRISLNLFYYCFCVYGISACCRCLNF